MPFIADYGGTITTFQGDSGKLVVNDLPTDQNYKLYFAIQDAKRNFRGKEVMVYSLNQPSVEIFIPAEVTDELTVPLNKSFETYYYGVKKVFQIKPGIYEEDTLFVNGGDFATKNRIIVYPKRVEGE